MELVNGKVIVMRPSGYESDEVAAEAIRLLDNWVRPRRLGQVAASSAGFRLSNASQMCVLPMRRLFRQSDCDKAPAPLQNWLLI